MARHQAVLDPGIALLQADQEINTQLVVQLLNVILMTNDRARTNVAAAGLVA
jgi:hypothetical protein